MLMNELLLLLPILIPLVGGVLIWFYRPKSVVVRNIVTEAIMIINCGVTWWLIFNRPEGELQLFSFSDKFPIVLSLDGLGCFFAAMTSTLAVFVTFYAFSYMKNEEHTHMFFTFFILTFAATGGISVAGNLITLYLFYEVLTMVTIPLVIHGCKKQDMHAARIYAAYQLGGAAFAFVGIVVLGGVVGNTSFVLGGTGALNGVSSELLSIIFVFMVLGFGVKACIFPFHGWLPTASIAPTPVTALLHSVAVVKAGIFAIMRMIYYNFGTEFIKGSAVGDIMLALAIFTAVFAAVCAVRERHFKRRLAYSTVSNLSYILIGVLLYTEAGFAAGLCHMLCHALIKMNGFLCVGSFMKGTGRAYVYELDGVGYKMPVTFVSYAISALALTGIPLTSGFVSKWKLVNACIEADTVLSFIGAAALLISAMLCAVYMIVPACRAFLRPKNGEVIEAKESFGMALPIALFAVVNIAVGIYAEPIVKLCENIASGLF